ncbi:hypothetical protein DY000_02017196 [Brassica cretica]|uniref:Uncharacterized protein n=1 Tax=Brassica cretica TaxID=69181 RepID=A0ABQ7CRJ3_BRACR|nr:hypothetical protein DY000_02017196 [Brassica cretica]
MISPADGQGLLLPEPAKAMEQIDPYAPGYVRLSAVHTCYLIRGDHAPPKHASIKILSHTSSIDKIRARVTHLFP